GRSESRSVAPGTGHAPETAGRAAQPSLATAGGALQLELCGRLHPAGAVQRAFGGRGRRRAVPARESAHRRGPVRRSGGAATLSAPAVPVPPVGGAPPPGRPDLAAGRTRGADAARPRPPPLGVVRLRQLATDPAHGVDSPGRVPGRGDP